MGCELPYGDVWIRARSRGNGRLPAYLGSMIRGVVAYRFKQSVCTVSYGECRRCHLRYRCPYPMIFEPPPFRAIPLLASEGNPPPLIFIPPLPASWANPTMQSFRAGDLLEFGIRVFGQGTRYLDSILEQLGHALRGGLGRSRIRFETEAVMIRNGQGIIRWDRRGAGELGTWLKVENPRDEGRRMVGQVRVRFLSPFRIKQKGHYRFDGSLRAVMAVLLRRFSRLCMLYGRYEAMDYTRPIQWAERCRVRERDIRWVDWIRLSRRQGVTMRLGGYIGEVVYEQVPWALYEWLKIGEVIHIGKNVIFGLGRISVDDEMG